MSFINIAIAHDATCKKGDEWLFHGMKRFKEDPKGESAPITEDEIEEVIGCCIVFCIILIVGIGFGIYYLITH
jgi:hypothetical protein